MNLDDLRAIAAQTLPCLVSFTFQVGYCSFTVTSTTDVIKSDTGFQFNSSGSMLFSFIGMPDEDREAFAAAATAAGVVPWRNARTPITGPPHVLRDLGIAMALRMQPDEPAYFNLRVEFKLAMSADGRVPRLGLSDSVAVEIMAAQAAMTATQMSEYLSRPLRDFVAAMAEAFGWTEAEVEEARAYERR